MILAFSVIVSTVALSKEETQKGVLVLVVIMDNQGQIDLHKPLNNTITFTCQSLPQLSNNSFSKAFNRLRILI